MYHPATDLAEETHQPEYQHYQQYGPQHDSNYSFAKVVNAPERILI
jgi:hypothetical protein